MTTLDHEVDALTEPWAPAGTADDPLLHAQVQAGYAAQMHLLDDGDGAAWAATFTDDGVFEANAHPEPCRGRSAIATAAQAVADDLAARGITRRHWLGMLSVRRTGPRTASARSYAIVLMTPLGGQPRIQCSTSCDDDLVLDGDRWLVRHRRVHRDDLP